VQRNTAGFKATEVIVSMQCVVDVSLLEGKTSKDIPAALLSALTGAHPAPDLSIAPATIDGLLTRIVAFAHLHQFDGVELDCHNLAAALPNEFDRAVVVLAQRLRTVTGNNNCPLSLSIRCAVHSMVKHAAPECRKSTSTRRRRST